MTTALATEPLSGPDRTAHARVCVETFGCAFNVSDSEVMSGLLERDGFILTGNPGDADVIIVNSCTVKDRTFRELDKHLHALGSDDRRSPVVILAGCAPRIPSQSEKFSHLSQIGPDNLAEIPDVVRRSLAGERVTRLDRRHDGSRLELPVRRRNAAIEIIPISKGCLGSCTFCQTVIARGRLSSFPEEHILARVRSAVDSGIAQIWLTSQDCGAYGLDCGTNLPRLMRKIAKLPGDFIVRVGMANPDLIKLFLRDFADALSDGKFYGFAHIPVQSGSAKVLGDMKRLYSPDDFLEICATLRERIPGIVLATDVIVGFPTETRSDFESTMSVLAKAAVPVINRSRFSPRPGTSAARLKQLQSAEVAARSKELLSLAIRLNRDDLEPWVGKTVSGIAEEIPKRGHAVLRSPHYRPIIVDQESAPGSKVAVEIAAIEKFHLRGNLITSPVR